MLELRRQPITSADDSRRAYDQVYAERGIRQLDSFYLWMLRALRVQPGRSLLDISCGEGQLLRLATAVGLRPYGVEISPAAVALARRAAPAAQVVVGDGERLPYPDGAFDYVTHIGSLEHYLNPAQGAGEVGRVLAPSGRACILLPNTFGLLWTVWHAWRTGDLYDDGFQPIQRYATRRQWQALLEASGLVVERTLGYNREWPRTAADWRWYVRHPGRFVFVLLSPCVPLNLVSCFAFVCHRASPMG